MKKFVSVLIAMLLTIGSTTCAFAVVSPEDSVKVSESDSLQYYATLTGKEMLNLGYSQSEITEIQNYKKNYAENIITYSNMQVEDLAEMGFSTTQIEAFQLLKAVQPTLSEVATEKEVNAFLQEYATTAVAATLTMDVIKYSKNGKNNKFKATWKWTGRPIIIGFKDTIAFVWTNGHTIESYDNIKVTLKCDSAINDTYTVPKKFKDICVPDQSIRVKFPTASNDGWLYKNGTCYITLKNDDNEATTTMTWKFAHGTVQITGFGINLKSGALNVTVGSKEMDKGVKTFKGLK